MEKCEQRLANRQKLLRENTNLGNTDLILPNGKKIVGITKLQDEYEEEEVHNGAEEALADDNDTIEAVFQNITGSVGDQSVIHVAGHEPGDKSVIHVAGDEIGEGSVIQVTQGVAGERSFIHVPQENLVVGEESVFYISQDAADDNLTSDGTVVYQVPQRIKSELADQDLHSVLQKLSQDTGGGTIQLLQVGDGGLSVPQAGVEELTGMVVAGASEQLTGEHVAVDEGAIMTAGQVVWRM